MSLVDLAVALLIAVGLVGILVPGLPGTLLVFVAVLIWATEAGGAGSWVVFGIAAVILASGAVVKYVLPGRHLKSSGVPWSTQWAGAALGVVGFFVVPIIGVLLGFVLGVYLAEWHRLGLAAAWPSTKRALQAAGLAILVELTAGLLATVVWVAGVLAT